MMLKFMLNTHYTPSGDQPKAIQALTEGVENGLAHQLLLGVTGSGKTFTIANLIHETQRPALVLAPNKTLAAQLYGELKDFFPNNAVEYFVSYYDYYQPEAYIPSSDAFIEKDAAINKHIEQLRLSATKSLLHRPDTLIVATVSAIYGLGDPEAYANMILHLHPGLAIDDREIIQHLVAMQYTRNALYLERGMYRVRGDIIDIFPAENEMYAVRVTLFDGEIEALTYIDPLTGGTIRTVDSIQISPKTHYATKKEKVLHAIDQIKEDLALRLKILREQNLLVEAQRLEQRTQFDIEMMLELGYCSGIENYSLYFSGRGTGQPPPTLMEYLPSNTLLVIDESHATIPQLKAMYRGDRSRKETLVQYGFRLPSAMDNRPLRFEEFESIMPQCIYVSATPGNYELEKTEGDIIELVVRPTSLLDPVIEVRPALSQVENLIESIQHRLLRQERVLALTLTKKMAEQLTEHLVDLGIRTRYLHSDVKTLERSEILRDLRLGVFDVLVGINLLREGLDLPEVSLVAILDADKEGFLRSERSLMQIIGRAARHAEGKALLYAEKITPSMEYAIRETQRRRAIQEDYNHTHNIQPKSIQKKISDLFGGYALQETSPSYGKKAADSIKMDTIKSPEALAKAIKKKEKAMQKASESLDFEQAIHLREEIKNLKDQLLISQKI